MKSPLGLQGTFKSSKMLTHTRSHISGWEGAVLCRWVCGKCFPGVSEELCPLQGGSLSGCLACLLLKQAAPHGMLSECFYTERNKVLCSEESGRTLAFNLSQLSLVWVLWVAMRRKMRHCTSHLGSLGAAEESALVSRFIRKTNKGKYSLKR